MTVFSKTHHSFTSICYHLHSRCFPFISKWYGNQLAEAGLDWNRSVVLRIQQSTFFPIKLVLLWLLCFLLASATYGETLIWVIWVAIFQPFIIEEPPIFVIITNFTARVCNLWFCVLHLVVETSFWKSNASIATVNSQWQTNYCRRFQVFERWYLYSTGTNSNREIFALKMWWQFVLGKGL